MKLSRNWIYLGITLAVLLAACGPNTPTPTGLVNQKTIPLPNVLVTVAFPQVAACNPPISSISDVTSFCASQINGQGGVTYTGPAYNWVTTSNDNCDFSQKPKVSCYGPQNEKFPLEICQSCGLPQPQALGAFVCSKGYVKDGTGNCINPNAVDGVSWLACPAGSHYDNGLQNCADDVTNQLASPCPPDHPYYIPDYHYCLAKASPVVYNCQSFTLQLGACTLNKVPMNVVSFCQNKGANLGGLNITVPAGSSLVVDTKVDGLDGCTSGGTQPDGTQLVTCWGASEKSFDAKLCTDPNQPATCTIYKEVLGACPLKKNPNNPNNPAPAPTACGHC